MTFCHPSVPFSSALLPVIPLPVRFIRGVIITGERRQNAGERFVPHKVEQDAVQILLNEEQSFLTLLQADFRTSKALSLFSFPFSLTLLFFISLLYLSHISPLSLFSFFSLYYFTHFLRHTILSSSCSNFSVKLHSLRQVLFLYPLYCSSQ